MATNRELLYDLAERLDEENRRHPGLDEALVGTADVYCGRTLTTRAVYDFEANVMGSIVHNAPVFLRKL